MARRPAGPSPLKNSAARLDAGDIHQLDGSAPGSAKANEVIDRALRGE